MARDCVDAILGVLLPPVQVYRKKQISTEFWIDLILFLIWFFGLGWLAILYCFHAAEGMDPVVNILCFFIPPLGLYLSTKQCDVDILICLLLWLFTWLGGCIWAYWKA